MAMPLDFCKVMPRPINLFCLILRRDYMWYDIWWTCVHVSRPCELVFALGLSLTSFHSGAKGFAILCFPRRILVNINALTVAFIEIWGNCPGLFLHYEHDFESPWVWNVNCWNSYIDYICWLAPVATDACCSVFIRSNIFGIGGKRSIRVCLNQGTANYIDTVCCIHQGKYTNQSHGVCLQWR